MEDSPLGPAIRCLLSRGPDSSFQGCCEQTSGEKRELRLPRGGGRICCPGSRRRLCPGPGWTGGATSALGRLVFPRRRQASTLCAPHPPGPEAGSRVPGLGRVHPSLASRVKSQTLGGLTLSSLFPPSPSPCGNLPWATVGEQTGESDHMLQGSVSRGGEGVQGRSQGPLEKRLSPVNSASGARRGGRV